MSMKGDFRASMMLWFPTDKEKALDVVENYIVARQAIEDFLNLQLHPSDFLDILNNHGVDVDDYCETLSENLGEL